MDRYRDDRSGDGGRHRKISRWSSGSPTNQQHRYPSQSRGGGNGGEGFSVGRHHPYRSPQDFPRGGGGTGFRGEPDSLGHLIQIPMGGLGRCSNGGLGRGESPDNTARGKIAKLFVGSVPRDATEEDIRPLFEEHGDVIEVALIKDRRTGEQQSCCFIKYATSDEADRAIRALHNQYTLPGEPGPIQVRYADGERERLGAVEHKLFVGSLNRQATEKEVEEIFSPYGIVEDVYLLRDDMKQSRGCGFVKFLNREMATAAMSALNGTFVMRGCDQPLIVRFADPKRPRPGESRGVPAFGGPGFGHKSKPSVGFRPTQNLGEPMGGRMPPNAWHPLGSPSLEPSSHVSSSGFESNLAINGSVTETRTSAPDTSGVPSGFANGSTLNLGATHSSSSQQGFNPSMDQTMPLSSPHQLPSSLQLYHTQQASASNLQTPMSLAPLQQHSQLQNPQSVGFSSLGQALPSQQLLGLGGQQPVSQSSMQQNVSATALQTPLSLQQQNVSATALQTPLSLQQHGVSPAANLLQLPSYSISQQSSSQLTQALLQQQAQALQVSFQSSHQPIPQIQQQLQLTQPSSLSQQQTSQTAKHQSPWNGSAPQLTSNFPTSTQASVMPTTVSMTPALSVATQSTSPPTCNWSEHTSPEGYKYYYNSITRESRWEKPEELTFYEQEQQKLQQQQKLVSQQPRSSSQTQSYTQTQSQQAQPQIQHRQQTQLQFLQPFLPYQAGVAGQQTIQGYNYAQIQGATSVVDPSRVQLGIQAAQELMWKNNPAGMET